MGTRDEELDSLRNDRDELASAMVNADSFEQWGEYNRRVEELNKQIYKIEHQEEHDAWIKELYS